MNNEHEYKGYKIKIVQDEGHESPDDWGDEGLFLVYDHRQFTVKREGFAPEEIYDYLKDPDSDEVWNFSEYYIFPVEAYIHSGVSLSLFNGIKECKFDSSVAGYILVNKLDLSKDEEPEGKAWTLANSMIETWNQYLSGEVYGYIIEKNKPEYYLESFDFDTMINTGTFSSEEFLNRAILKDYWEEIDSCWGFYGDPDGYILEEAKFIVDSIIKHENDEN